MELLLIGNFSKQVGVSKRMLRHYEKLGLLTPVNVDEQSGYRYYSTNQSAIVKQIKHLQEFGFSLVEIKGLLNDDLDFSHFIDRLKDQEAILRQESDAMNRHLMKLQYFIDYVEKHPNQINTVSNSPFDILPLNNQLTPKRSMTMTTNEIKSELNAILNKDLYEDRLDEVCTQTVGIPKVMITIDIDNFMYINDDYGFDVGDQIIYYVYKTFYSTFEPLFNENELNIFTRLGGDEFVFLLVNSDIEKVKDCCSKVVNTVSTHDFSALGCDRQVTVSIGIVMETSPERSMILRHRSVKALMQAKRNGRNQYAFLE